MFGVPASKIVQIKNPYAPKEILDKFPSDTTAFVTVVGEKDRYRLKGKYFEPYHPDRIEKGYKDKGYVYVTAAAGDGISGTEVRKSLSSGDDEVRKKGFKKAYNKFDPKIYKFITNRLSKIEIRMERFLSTFDFNKMLSESTTQTSIGGNSQGVDDGPGFTYGNSKTYKSVGDETARRLGWQVVDYILGADDDSIFADDDRILDDKYPVSYFPAGIDGLDSLGATVNFELLEQWLRCGRRDEHRFLLLYLSVPIYDAHCASSARSCLAPKVLFLWSTTWTSVGSASLSLSLAKGRTIQDAPPTPQFHPNSTTPNAASKSTPTNQPPPPKNNPQQSKKTRVTKKSHTNLINPTRNFKDENGDEVQVYSQNTKGRYTSVCDLF